MWLDSKSLYVIIEIKKQQLEDDETIMYVCQNVPKTPSLTHHCRTFEKKIEADFILDKGVC